MVTLMAPLMVRSHSSMSGPENYRILKWKILLLTAVLKSTKQVFFIIKMALERD